MLASMLNSHPMVEMAPETWWLGIANELKLNRVESHFLRDAFLLCVRRNFLNQQNLNWVKYVDWYRENVFEEVKTYDDMYRDFIKGAKVYFGVTVIGEKTPAHTTFMPEILRKFPEIKKILLTRDPRDIVVSYIKAWGEGGNLRLDDILITLKVYLINLSILDASNDAHLISYERLTSDPRSQMKKLLCSLNLPFSDSVLQLKATTKAVGIHRNLSKGVFDNSNNFIKNLSEDDVLLTELVLKEEMEAFNYELFFEGKKRPDLLKKAEWLRDQAYSRIEKARQLKDSGNWNPGVKSMIRAARIHLSTFKHRHF